MFKNDTLTIPSIPRPLLNGLWLSIASVLRWINRDYDDRELRLHMCELTPDEARAEIRGDIANHDKHMREAMAWSDMWHEGGG